MSLHDSNDLLADRVDETRDLNRLFDAEFITISSPPLAIPAFLAPLEEEASAGLDLFSGSYI